MLDNLRDQASFTEEEEPPDPNAPEPPKPRRGFDQISGTTAMQRFVLAVLFSIIVCLLGAMFLVFSGKMVLPNYILDFLNQLY
jgi:hypothetical protein